MVLLRPTRPHAAHLVFHCLDLSKDPNWIYCMHPDTHLAIRDCRHLCRSPPCSPCFLHIKNLVDVLNLFFIPVHPKDPQKNSSNCAVVVHNPSPSLLPLSLSRRLQSRDRKHQVHDSTAPVISLFEAALNFANTSKPLSIRRSLTSCRASSSEGGLLKHGMLELKLVPLTAHASPAHLLSGFQRAWSKIGPFERSSRRCGQPKHRSHAHVEK